MKSTLSDVRQLFNVKKIAAAGQDPSAIKDGEFGIVDESTNQTVSPTDFDSLPEQFRFISKFNGRVIYSFDTINKKYILNQQTKKYQEEQVEVWKTVIKSCDCTKSVRLDIFYDEDALMRRDGLTWTHRDNYVEVSPAEFACYCDCSGKGVYENNVMTMLLYKKIKETDSYLYDVKVKVVDGEELKTLDEIVQFIENNKDINTDDDDTNDGKRLELIIEGKKQTVYPYNHPDVTYVYPRGVNLKPSITVNSNTTNMFEKVQDLRYEIGNGVDLRAEEYENMNFYTNLNFYPELSDGVPNPDYVNAFQFSNDKKYDTFTFEFDSKKVERAGDGDLKRFGVILASEEGNGIVDKLKAMFQPA